MARVEGYVHEQAANFGEAFESYSRAKDLAPKNPYIAYAFGAFLLSSGFDPRTGLTELQRAQPFFQTLFVQIAVCDAHLQLGAAREAIDAASYVLGRAQASQRGQGDAAFSLARAFSAALRESERHGDWSTVAEDLEVCVSLLDGVDASYMYPEALDLCLHLQSVAANGSRECADNYIAERLTTYATRLHELRGRADAGHLDRRLGTVQHLSTERGFGFLSSDGKNYFFHASEMADRRIFEYLAIGSRLTFTEGRSPRQGKTPH